VKTVHVILEGRVQGVWFRAWTAERAVTLGLRGWVRNRGDGTVEALFSGPSGAVSAMLDACHKGPPLARVDAVRVADTDAQPPSGFEQRPTA
jgi:acylphosphatase